MHVHTIMYIMQVFNLNKIKNNNIWEKCSENIRNNSWRIFKTYVKQKIFNIIIYIYIYYLFKRKN